MRQRLRIIVIVPVNVPCITIAPLAPVAAEVGAYRLLEPEAATGEALAGPGTAKQDRRVGEGAHAPGFLGGTF